MSPIANLALRAAAAFASAQPAAPGPQTVGITPHDSYSSSIGVLGCKIDTDRVAYWPMMPDCQNICVKVTNGPHSVNLLRIDQSGGAYDISYDAYSVLTTGKSAVEAGASAAGGAVSMTYENVDPSECAGLLYTGKFPLMAANSMDFLSSCLTSAPNSYVSKNYELWNIADATCTLGVNERCTLTNFPAQNQPTCPSQLGLQTPLTTQPTHNVEYPDGKNVTVTTI